MVTRTGIENKIPFVPSLLVEFRKRLSEDVLNEINEMIIAYNAQKDDQDDNDNDHDDDGGEQEQNEQPECHNYISFSC